MSFTMSHDFDQTALLGHESDLKRPKRQRLDSTVAPDQHAHPTLALHPAKSHVDGAGAHIIGFHTTQSFTDTQQLEIYYAWHQAGSPHNYVCYECRKPYDLICCKTCCRAYHVECLSSKPVENSIQDKNKENEWHCDACKRRKWDTNPPLSHELPSHPNLHPSQNSRSHSWAATSNRLEPTPSRKLQSFSEGHYPRRSSKLRHFSDISTEEIFEVPHSHPFVARPREPSRISEGDEAAAEEVEAAEQQTTTLPVHERNTTTPTLVIEQWDEHGVITQMRADIASLREELGKKNSEIGELEELRKENALLKSKIESLEATSVDEEGHAKDLSLM